MARANMRDLSFATINLFNLQVPGGITYSNRPHIEDDAEGRAYYQRKIKWTAARLKEVDAEVVAFQELWSVLALRECFAEAGLTNDYDLVVRDAPGRGRPQVALAVRKGRDAVLSWSMGAGTRISRCSSALTRCARPPVPRKR